MCVDIDKDNWEEIFLAQLGCDIQGQETDESDNEIELDDEPCPLKVKSFKEAIDSLQEIGRFLESRGCDGIGNTMDTLASLGVATRNQTLLGDFFAQQLYSNYTSMPVCLAFTCDLQYNLLIFITVK